MKIATLLVLSLLVACKTKAHQTDHVSKAFDTKFQAYVALSQKYPTSDCDWLLFQSLTDAALNVTGNVEAAEGEPGRWFRTPGHDCLPTGRSKSDISRDMLLGLSLYLWQTDGRQDMQDVVDYADAHEGVMGQGELSRTQILLTLYHTYKAMLARVGHIPLPPKIDNPNIDADVQSLAEMALLTGFEAHLTVLHIFLRGLVYGELSQLELEILSSQAERQPRNAFYQAVYHKFLDGDQTAAVAALMDETLFPKESLPTADNYCTPWLWQRDDGEDWQPCPDAPAHTGGDWIFAAEIIRNGFREAVP